jgi:NADP-dependent 3-hydroxy acid dehydrogenase YdfG
VLRVLSRSAEQSGLALVFESEALAVDEVLITGCGSGLGRETGLLFASEGAKVGVNDVRPELLKMSPAKSTAQAELRYTLLLTIQASWSDK